MTPKMRVIVISLRLAAAAVMIASVYLLSRVMLWLPWEVDCVIAAAAALAFAYRFEREASS
jgi:chromate transport protein ChrA